MFGVVQERNVNVQKKPKPKKTMHSFPSFSRKKVLVWIVVVVFIVLLIGYYLYKNYYSNYNYIKQDTSQYLVYTIDTSVNGQNMHSEIPFVNIDSEDANTVNQTIQNYADSFLENRNNLMVYDSQVNGEVLSLLLRMSDYSSGYSFPDVTFHTYNFNLNTQSLMNDKLILSLFDVTEKKKKKKIEIQFRDFYEEEVYKGYLVEEECDYECFLEWRGVEDYMDSVYYYIENGKLMAYRPFTIYSVYGEEEFFTEEDYAFYIAG